MPASAVRSVPAPPYKLNGRRFGVEFEFVGAPWSEVENNLRRFGLKIIGYDDWSDYDEDDSWYIDEDGSLVGSWSGELKTPPLKGSEGVLAIAEACEALDLAHAEANDSCGLHVHHEAKDLERSAVVRLLENYMCSQRAIDEMVVPWRKGGCSYAPGLTRSSIDELRASVLEKERFRLACLRGYRRVVNVSNLGYARGTIEFRQHHGSLDVHEVLPWVAFGQAMIAAAAACERIATSSRRDLLKFLSEHGLDDASSAALADRSYPSHY